MGKNKMINRFASIFVITAILSVLAFSLYAYTPGAVWLNYRGGKVENTTITTTSATTTVYGSLSASNKTWTFQNGNVLRLVYFSNYSCAPLLTSIYNSQEASNATASTGCVYGAPAASISGATPSWRIFPSFAGLSDYGFNAYGTTPQGYPVYNGTTIATQCGAANTPTACIGRPTSFYSPVYSAAEKSVNITKGIGGLPQGVFWNGAHDAIASSAMGGKIAPHYRIAVWVFDPNIYPNLNGTCKQMVQSNVTNPTGNCLTSSSALQSAISTKDSAVAAANGNNPLWIAANKPVTEAVILMVANATAPVTYSANINASNTNLVSYSYVNVTKPSTTTVTTTASPTTAATTVQQNSTVASSTISYSSGGGSSSNTALYAGIVVVIIIIVVAAWFMMRKK